MASLPKSCSLNIGNLENLGQLDFTTSRLAAYIENQVQTGNPPGAHSPHIGGAKSYFDVVLPQNPRKIEIYLSRPRYLSSSAQTPGIPIFMYEEL